MAVNTKTAEGYIERDALLLNAVTPQLMEHPKRIDVDDFTCTVVTFDDFMVDNNVGWLDCVLNRRNTPVSIRIEPLSTATMKESIDQHERQVSDSMFAPRMTASKMDALQRDAAHGHDMLAMMGDQGERFFNTTISAIIRSEDEEQLVHDLKFFRSSVAAAGMGFRTIMHNQLDALMSCSPLMPENKTAFEQAVRPFPSRTLGFSLFPREPGLDDGCGIRIGHDSLGGIARLNIVARTPTRPNSNIVIFGESGSGKSVNAKLLALMEYLLWGSRVIIFDPEGEFKALVRALGGDVISIGAQSASKISPLQPRALTFSAEEDAFSAADVDDEDAGMQLVLLSTIPFAKAFLQQAFNIVDEDMDFLERALEAAYALYGITPQMTFAEYRARELSYPIMSDLYETLVALKDAEPEHREQYDRLSYAVRTAATGINAPLWNTRSSIESNADILCISTEGMGADQALNNAQYYNLLTWVWSEVRMAPSTGKPVRVIIDEAHNFINANSIVAADAVKSMAKRIRKYGGGLTVVTQEPGDLLNDLVYPYGAAILNNSTYRFVGRCDGENARVIRDLWSLSPETMESISKYTKGQFAVFAGSNDRSEVKIDVDDWMFGLFGDRGGY